MKALYALIATLLLASTTFAQQPPPPAEGGQPPPREGAGGPPPGPGRRGPYDGSGPRGEGPRDVVGPRDGAGDPRMQRFELMRGYLDLVDRYARLAHDSTSSGIAAVVAAGDILKPRGTDAAIEFFTKSLAEVKSPAVGRAIRLQLIELYKQAGKQDEALAQLKTLMTAEPAKE
jgi:hypothetical protein